MYVYVYMVLVLVHWLFWSWFSFNGYDVTDFLQVRTRYSFSVP
jgi:hypothetical protein